MANPLPKGTFVLNAVTYAWEVRHYAGATTPYEDARGISVGLALDGVSRKGLIIDFPFKDYGFGKPRSLRMLEDRIRKCVPLALAKGWEPESKGKPMRMDSEFLEDRQAPRK